MPEFTVLLSISNILISDRVKRRLGKKAQQSRSLGAVTTRHVTASNEEEAYEFAKNSAEAELRISDISPVLNDSKSPLMFDLEEIKERFSQDVSPNKGFTFFLEPPLN